MVEELMQLASFLVVFAANYRLSAFGFMALDELAAESGGTTGNYALQVGACFDCFIVCVISCHRFVFTLCS